MSRNPRSRFSATDDSSQENRLTGAFAHTFCEVDELLSGVLELVGEGYPDLKIGKCELRKWITYGELDAYAEIEHNNQKSVIIIESKNVRLDVTPWDVLTEEELSESSDEDSVFNQLKRYSIWAMEDVIEECIVLLITKDSSAPPVIEMMEEWLRGEEEGRKIRLAWIGWHQIHHVAEKLALSRRNDGADAELLADFVTYLEVKRMVSDRITGTDMKYIKKVPEGMVDIWTPLDLKGIDFRDMLRKEIQEAYGLPNDETYFYRKKFMRHAQKGDPPVWTVRARWNTEIPLYFCVDICFPLLIFEVTIRKLEPENWEKGMDAIRHMKIDSKAINREFEVQKVDPVVEKPKLWVNGQRLIKISDLTKPEHFKDLDVPGVLKMAQTAKDIIDTHFVP